MEKRLIPNCGLEVSEIGLGTMTWGRDTDEFEARDQFEYFLEAGGNYIDTADVYSDGLSEQMLGQFISASDASVRNEVLIATKGGRIRNKERSVDNSFTHLTTALNNSLERLEVDFVDLYFIHARDEHTPLDSVVETIGELLNSGKTKYVAVSNFSSWEVTYISAQLSSSRFVGTQNEYSLLKRDPERELFPALEFSNLGFFACSPLGRGVLTGKYRNSIPADSRAASPHLGQFVRQLLSDKNQKIVEALTTAASGLGSTALELALLWNLKNPRVSTAITGARNAAQLRTIIHALETDLPDQIYTALCDISKDN